MAHTPKTFIAASTMSLLLAIAATHASAQSSKGGEAMLQREAAQQDARQQTAAQSDIQPIGLDGIEGFFDRLMKAIVKSYRKTTQQNALREELSQDDGFKQVIGDLRRAEALEDRFNDTPELLQNALKPQVPLVTPQNTSRVPSIITQTPINPVGPVAEDRPVATPQVPEQTAPAAQVPTTQTPQVVSNTPAQVAPVPVVTPPPTPVVTPPPPVIGSAKLSWSIPTQRENGDALALNEISSYEIYVTAENAGTSRTIRVDNRNQTQFTLDQLSEDTYYFSMVTIDTEGMYSELSQVVSKTIQ